ncbi:MAG: hypothetical protein IT529_06285 [Burkholderiales bacterium]|nr:hypothetical protein [Burkholderiales bacterium]
MRITRDMVLATLSRHIGEANGISVEALVRQFEWDPEHYPARARQVRKLVSELREEGVAICAHPSTGYFIAATPAELETCCQFLRARAMHSLVLEARLRKIPLPELLGQMRLPT